jgi:omega-6 fatty acid desaturase / acyl-lipid omega-6 desaturase (Delta-12 desaturase)
MCPYLTSFLPLPSLFSRPAYLIANVAGPKKYQSKPNSHFSTISALFAGEGSTPPQRAARRWEIIVSDIGFFGALAAVVWACVQFGVQAVATYYFIPYLVVNMNLVLITYLQHTDEYVPHYRPTNGVEFPWLRGALATVDRSYGWLLDIVFHHISDTHVVHHLFHEMPFYNAIEATIQVRKFLGDYYLVDHTPTPVALWKAWKTCRFVEDEGLKSKKKA